MRQRGIQEVDGVAIAGPVTLRSVRIEQPIPKHELLDHVRAGVDRRPGPVFLELCLDAQGAVVDRADLEPRAPSLRTSRGGRRRRRGCGGAVDHRGPRPIARPVLADRRRCQPAVAATALERDLAAWGVPVMTTWNGADRLDTDHPAYFGRPNTWGQRSSNVLLQQADLVIALGTRLGLQQTGFNWQQFAPLAVVAQVDIDEAELTKGHPRVDLAVRRRRRCRARRASCGRAPPAIDEWVEFCREVRRLLPIEDPGNVTGPGLPRPVPLLGGALGALRDQRRRDPVQQRRRVHRRDAGVPPEGRPTRRHRQGPGEHGLRPERCDRRRARHRTPNACCSKATAGSPRTCRSSATVAVNDLPLKIFLFSNEGYASIRMTQRNYFDGGYLGCDTKTGLGFPSWPELFGAYGIPILELDRDVVVERGLPRALRRRRTGRHSSCASIPSRPTTRRSRAG